MFDVLCRQAPTALCEDRDAHGLTKCQWIGTIWVHDGPVAWHVVHNVPLRNANTDAARANAPAAP
jgi:hypothetical protein